jgi:hypothetical protein
MRTYRQKSRMPTPDTEPVPQGVLPYLLPTEMQVISLHKHLAVLILPICLLVADVITFALNAADVIPRSAEVLTVLGIIFVPSGYFLYHRVLIWSRTFFVVTSNRIILINWQRKRRLLVIPIAGADDMSFIRTVPGRLLGYGSFLLYAADLPKRAFKIGYLPYPEQLYLEVSALIFRDV